MLRGPGIGTSVVLVGALFLGVGTGAWATGTVVWFPLANAHQTVDPHESSPWGDADDNPVFSSLVEGQGNNPVWNAGSVFYSTGTYDRSWFTAGNGAQTWTIYIHNPTDTDFDGTTKEKITLKLWNANGTQADEDTNWGGWPAPTQDLINEGVNGGNVTWEEEGEDCFNIEVAAHETARVVCWGASDKALYSTPGTTGKWAFGAAIELEQPDGEYFTANLRGQNFVHWREREFTFSDTKVMAMNWGYNGIYEDDIDDGSHTNTTVLLPHYKELRLSGNTQTGWATSIILWNPNSTQKTYLFESYKLDGSDINTANDGDGIDLGGHCRVLLAPSQLMDSPLDSSQQEGYVEITGDSPVAIAVQFRFPKLQTADDAYLISGELPRIPCSQAMELFPIDWSN